MWYIFHFELLKKLYLSFCIHIFVLFLIRNNQIISSDKLLVIKVTISLLTPFILSSFLILIKKVSLAKICSMVGLVLIVGVLLTLAIMNVQIINENETEMRNKDIEIEKQFEELDTLDRLSDTLLNNILSRGNSTWSNFNSIYYLLWNIFFYLSMIIFLRFRYIGIIR